MKINENIYELIESCLKELSDIEFQKRVWVYGEGEEVSSYIEVACQLFDDTGIGDQLDDVGVVVLSENLDPIFRELSSLIDKIDDQLSAVDIINHPIWPKVVKVATKALIQLEEIK